MSGTLRRPATLKSLGQLLGVSPSLISRVLRNDRNGRVSEAKRAEILAAVRTSGYRPNHAGRALRNQKTKIIALAVPDVINPFYATLFRAVESAALARDYTVILCNTDESNERFSQLFENIGNRHVDGWLIATATGQDPYLPRLRRENTPFILLNRRTRRSGVSWIGPDDFQTGWLGADHLLRLGHQRIGYLSADSHIESMKVRLDGFREAVRAHAGRVDESLIASGSLDSISVKKRALKLLQQPAKTRPTALLVSHSASVGAVLAAIGEMGLKIPQDISIVGYNTTADVYLSGLIIPVEQIAIEGTDWLLDILSGERKVPAINRTLPVAFVDRGTTATLIRD
jgi:LacI family transcriptional regulator